MDELEKHIRAHREELDHLEKVDAGAIWSRLQPRLRAGIQEARQPGGWHVLTGRNWRLAIAAGLCLAMGLSWWLWRPAPEEASGTGIQVAGYYPEFAPEESALRRQVAEKEAAIGFDTLSRKSFSDLFAELDELEEIQRRQMAELPEVVNDPEWVHSLIRYYEQKIRILELLSREMEKKHHHEEKIRERHS